ncbi:MAG: competence/damage-inducible protein A [Candidatus Aminicenantes bacterium]|nr:competence/damage-inducible protein A [Candidatus Aminicenantes bacterium]
MRAIFIAVGSELLDLDRVDTNSIYVARRLREKGILTDMKVAVGDHVDNLSWIVKKACQRAQLVILSGGLGPTEDDVTREAVAAALKRKLLFREEIVAELEAVFRRRGMAMPEINARQAFVIEGAEVLANPVGTAPGLLCDEGNCKVLLLPGPPAELVPMFESVYTRHIAPAANHHVVARTFKLTGISESEADSRCADIYRRYRNPVTTILASPGLIELHLLGRSKNSDAEARRLTDELADKLRERLGEFIFAERDVSLPEVVVEGLQEKGLTLAVAESCTGGGLGDKITSVPGSSAVFLGGVIAYADALKTGILGVRAETLKRHGAVSQAAAGEMAAGVRRLCRASLGLAITGIAGPGGGDRKPVGLVHMHLSADGHEQGLRQIFTGNREIVKLRSEYSALNLVREYVSQLSADGGRQTADGKE